MLSSLNTFRKIVFFYFIAILMVCPILYLNIESVGNIWSINYGDDFFKALVIACFCCAGAGFFFIFLKFDSYLPFMVAPIAFIIVGFIALDYNQNYPQLRIDQIKFEHYYNQKLASISGNLSQNDLIYFNNNTKAALSFQLHVNKYNIEYNNDELFNIIFKSQVTKYIKDSKDYNDFQHRLKLVNENLKQFIKE